MTTPGPERDRQTMAEQLRPIQPWVRQRHSAVVPVSQVLLQLLGPDKSQTFQKARGDVLSWISGRAGRALPDHAWKGESFDLEEVGSQRVAAVVLDDPCYWAARLDDADKVVAQRTWVTEIGIAEHPKEGVIFGARLICVTRGRDEPYARTVPGFVRQIAGSGIARLDGSPVRAEPWLIASEDDVQALVKLLLAPRRSDVIVLSLPEHSEDPRDTAVSAKDVYRGTLGAAHVAVLTGPASFHLSDRVGKEFSVFRQGIRTYRPGFDPDHDEPFEHPLALPGRIADWPDGGSEAYARFLVDQSLLRSVSRSDAQESVPSFAMVRQIVIKRRLDTARKGASSDKDLLALAEEEIRGLRENLEEQKRTYSELLTTAEHERDDALAAAEAAKARAGAMRYRLDSLEAALRQRADHADDVPIPTTFEGFDEWCATWLAGTVEVHSRALQGIKKSEFQSPELAYQALLLLRDYYVPMKRQGGIGLKSAFDDQCGALGLEEGPTFSANRWGEEGDTYIVRIAGQKRLLERHLKNGGNTRDPRRCFRVYFFWDEESEQAVVGWLPSHLDSRAT